MLFLIGFGLKIDKSFQHLLERAGSISSELKNYQV